MTTIVDEEKVRRALAWISEERRQRPQAKTERLVEEASTQFDLTPSAEEWLRRILREGPLSG